MSEPIEPKKLNRYQQIIEHIFLKYYADSVNTVDFRREDIETAAHLLQIPLPKNIGDILYTFRYRGVLPATIRQTAPMGMEWIIRPMGRGLYRFVIVHAVNIVPNPMLAETKIPDATPGIVAMYALSDEQALLAKVRYNRLIDIFTGVTCYSLQNHLRTTVPEVGQVETDEIYIGIDRRGAHYVFPVQAKGGKDKIGLVQIEQDIDLCAAKFPQLICRPIAAQFMSNDLIALFDLEKIDDDIRISAEKHYRLVSPSNIAATDLDLYATRATQ